MIAAVYITVILVEFYFWPGCEVNAIPVCAFRGGGRGGGGGGGGGGGRGGEGEIEIEIERVSSQCVQ